DDVALWLQFSNSDDLAQRDDRRDRGGIDGITLLVDGEAAIGIAVEGEPEVGAVFDDSVLQVNQVGWFERVRLVVGEAPVEFEIERNDLDRKLRQPGGLAEHRWHGEPA